MISAQEFAERHKKLRAVMAQAGYGALLLPGIAEATQRGYVRYVSDWRLWGGRGFVYLPLEGEPVLVLGSGSQPNWARQVAQIADVRAAGDAVAEVCSLIQQLPAQSKVGVPGLHHVLLHGDALRFQSTLTDYGLVDATDAVDAVMAIKSPAELDALRTTATAVGQALVVLRENFAPGRTERDVMATATHRLAELGCLDGIAHLSTETRPFFHPPTKRRITPDDVIKVSLEFSGPEGYWIEMSGVYSFQEPSERLQRYHATTVKALEAVGAMLRPGVTGGDVTRTIEQVIRDDGWEISGRGLWDGHLIGLNVIRPPYAVLEDTNQFAENMVLNVHPGILVGDDALGMFLQDNFIVTPTGGEQIIPFEHKWDVIDAAQTGG